MFQWRTCFHERNLPMVVNFLGGSDATRRSHVAFKQPGKLQRLEKNVKTLKLKVRWWFFLDPCPCHFLFFFQESDIFNGLLVGCGFGVPLQPFTDIILIFTFHWLVGTAMHRRWTYCISMRIELSIFCICICILNIHFVHKSTVFSSSFWMEVWRYLAETLN